MHLAIVLVTPKHKRSKRIDEEFAEAHRRLSDINKSLSKNGSLAAMHLALTFQETFFSLELERSSCRPLNEIPNFGIPIPGHVLPSQN